MTQQFPPRPRISSLEKRKAIEASLQDFKKDLNEAPSSLKSSRRKATAKDNDSQLQETPTMKDLVFDSEQKP